MFVSGLRCSAFAQRLSLEVVREPQMVTRCVSEGQRFSRFESCSCSRCLTPLGLSSRSIAGNRPLRFERFTICGLASIKKFGWNVAGGAHDWYPVGGD